MEPHKLEEKLKTLFEDWSKEKAAVILPLAPSGSKRIYYKIEGDTKKAIGTFNPIPKENETFIYLSHHFKSKGIPVPEVYALGDNKESYIQEDLGFTTLYSFLLNRKEGAFPAHLMDLYLKVVKQLAYIQIKGKEDLDFNKCYPNATFDKQSILLDLQYFKYYGLKFADIDFDEAALEQDFRTLADFLLEAENDYFMFRDFQTRNIMIKEGEPFFIDFQGGKKGALQYDLASLLFQAKADLPFEVRIKLLEAYLEETEKLIPLDRKAFIKYYYAFVLVRCLQVFGAYGFRGIYQRKKHFLDSIPYAIKNLKWLMEEVDFQFETPTLFKATKELIASKLFKNFDKAKGANSILNVSVNSFSYKKGIPKDKSGHGGGFVFDCRFLHNPGRYEPYKELTGRDESVMNFLEQHSNIADFVNNVSLIVDKAVMNYIERSFSNLSVNFGCTGGKHRSVYMADKIAKHIASKFGVKVNLLHRERGWEKEEL